MQHEVSLPWSVTFDAIARGVHVAPSGMEVRITVDGVPCTDWGPPPRTCTIASVAATTPNGLPYANHVAWPEVRGPTSAMLAGLLFGTGSVPALDVTQAVWAAPTIFDGVVGAYPADVGPILTTWPGTLPAWPVIRDYPTRPRPSWGGTYPSPAQLWVTRLGTVHPQSLGRQWTQTAKGRITTAAYQQYHHYDLRSRAVPLTDGPRGVGRAGHLWEMRVDPADGQKGGVYGIATNGRLLYIHGDGRVVTIAGLRSATIDEIPAPGTNVPLSQRWTKLPPYWEDAWAADALELVGDWFGVTPAGFNEPWGFDFLEPRADRHREVFAVCDTLNDRVLKVDHRPAHEPGGKAKIALLASFAPGSEPWGCTLGPDGQLYVSLRTAHEIWRVDPATGAKALVVSSVLKPRFGDPGLPRSRDSYPYVDYVVPSKVRAAYHRAGLPGTASFAFPTGLRFDSTGRLWCLTQYGYQFFTVDTATGEVSLQWSPWKDVGRDLRQPAFDIAVDGTVGPLDSIYVTAWGLQTDQAHLVTGRWLGSIMREELSDTAAKMAVEGPLPNAVVMAYPAGIAVGQGAIFLSGIGTTQSVRMISRRLATDTFDATTYAAGRALYTRHLALQYGDEGQGYFGYVPGAAEVAALGLTGMAPGQLTYYLDLLQRPVTGIMDPLLSIEGYVSEFNLVTVRVRTGATPSPDVGDLYVAIRVPGGFLYTYGASSFHLAFDGGGFIPASLVPWRSNVVLSPRGNETVFAVSTAEAPGEFAIMAVFVRPGTDPLNPANWISNLAQQTLILRSCSSTGCP